LGMCLVYLCICLVNAKAFGGVPYMGFVLLLVLTPLLSVFPAYFEHGQYPHHSLVMLRYELVLLAYPAHVLLGLNLRDFCKVLIGFSMVWAFITIVQQTTYPHYFFAARTDDYLTGKVIEIRSGFYRFNVMGVYLSVIAAFIAYDLYLQLNRKAYLFCFLFVCLGVVCFMTRQVLVAYFSGVIFLGFLQEKKWLFILQILCGVVVVGWIAVHHFNDWIDLYEKTLLDFEYNIRFETFRFYLFEYWSGPLSVIFGNGIPFPSTEFGAEMRVINLDYGYYQSDVGIVGALNRYGVVYMIVFVAFYASLLRDVFKSHSALLGGCTLFFTMLLLMIYVLYTPLTKFSFMCYVMLICLKVFPRNSLVMIGSNR